MQRPACFGCSWGLPGWPEPPPNPTRAHPPSCLPPPCRLCPNGQAPALLKSGTNGVCTYAECGEASAIEGQAPAAGSDQAVANAAAMAAPAVVLTLIVVAFVEILMHCC